jgi:hypothetical protein|eukprot:COSAG06_NODE_6693_length_2821_cov_48.493387_2_plen_39_part_00
MKFPELEEAGVKVGAKEVRAAIAVRSLSTIIMAPCLPA